MTLRRYLLVRTGWAAGMLFAFVSIAYLVVWVAGDLRRDPGYGGFLWDLLHGSLGRMTFSTPGSRDSVDSLVWAASKVTISLLFVTALFTLVLAVALALVARHGRAARASVRSFEFLGVSLLPTWTALLIGGYLAGRAGLLHPGGYCPLVSASPGPFASQCHGPAEWLAHLVWPAVTLTIFYAAIYSRIVRHDLKEARRERRSRVEEGEDAELVRRDVRRFYGAVYAKRIARDFGFGLGFALLIEPVFGLPGLGTAAEVSRFPDGDGHLLAGVLVGATLLATVVSLAVDLVVAVLDPRFRRF